MFTAVVIFITFTTAICVWLLPIANNTLLIPKLIYHPLCPNDGYPQELAKQHLYTPRVVIDDVYWDDTQSAHEFSMNGTMAIALQGRLSSLIYSGFLDFNESYHAGWNEATRYPEKYSTTYMHLDAYSVRAASVRTVDVEQLFEASNTYGPPFAKLSVRKLGDINVTTPSVEVRCAISTSDLNTPPGITISEIDDSSSRTPFVSVHLDEVNSMNSSATRYNISLYVYLPIRFRASEIIARMGFIFGLVQPRFREFGSTM